MAEQSSQDYSTLTILHGGGRKASFYGVKVGREPGVYDDWEHCKRQVLGYPGNIYKSFQTRGEAEKYVWENSESSDSTAISIRGFPEDFKVKDDGCQMEHTAPQVVKVGDIIGQECGYSWCTDKGDLGVQVQSNSSESIAITKEEGIWQLEFDGASKGNPGRAGAGALVRCPHGVVIMEFAEHLEQATNNIAEYRSLILGLKGALSVGVQRIKVQGDSKLVCMQVRGLWKVHNENLMSLHKEVSELQKQFKEFSIDHVERRFNSAADALANVAVSLGGSELVREVRKAIPKCCISSSS